MSEVRYPMKERRVMCAHGKLDCPACGRIVVLRYPCTPTPPTEATR